MATLAPFTKIIRLGIVAISDNQHDHVYCKIEWTGTRLSITGVIGPKRNGDCVGSCGQINHSLAMNLYPFTMYAPRWTRRRVNHFLRLWEEWHLNDLHAGTPAQDRLLRRYQAHVPTWRYDYDNACTILWRAGLYEDNGYKYGSKWLHLAVPEAVISYLAALPETDRTPAWI